MVTGDNLKTASAIADKAGIFRTGDIAMEGPEFRKLTPAQLDEMLPRLTVICFFIRLLKIIIAVDDDAQTEGQE